MMKRILSVCFVGLLLFGLAECQNSIKDRERGALIGKLSTEAYEVSGTVWALDEATIYIEDFTYNGEGPDGWFWMGTGVQPNPTGYIIPYPKDKPNEVLPRIDRKNIVLKLPNNKKIADHDWFSVWCRRFTVNFGSVSIPKNLVLPKKKILPEFSRLGHQVRSGKITILDSKTFYVPNLHYDGAGPDAFFWVGKGRPSSAGQKIPNEVGSYDVLRSYEGEDIELMLPGNLTVYDIDYLSVWCVRFREDFGHVLISHDDLWVPPAKGQTDIRTESVSPSSFPNCLELKSQTLQVEWEPLEDVVKIRISAKIEENDYVAFGVSGNVNRPEMINSDVVVVYYDATDGSFNAVDYSITSKSQCDGTYGVCPDERTRGINDATVISGDRRDGVTTITYTRPYRTQDRYDKPISKNSESAAVIAAIGPLNLKKEASYHQNFVTNERITIDFSSKGKNTCSQLAPSQPRPQYEPWKTNILTGVTNFTATMGPTGGQKGYQAITGFPSWGIAWWINSLLIPEIYLERGVTYFFSVQGGDDPTIPAKYHPFYITNSEEGGYGNKKEIEQQSETVYAGVAFSKLGQPFPTAVGRLCEFRHSSVDRWAESATFNDYLQTLHPVCTPGLPGILEWTVPENAPDLLYYQCYTHRNLGWKIHITDPGANEIYSGTAPRSQNLDIVVLAIMSILPLLR